MKRIAIPVLLLALTACSPQTRAPRTSWSDGRAQVHLDYRGRAESVCVVGDFNGWQPGIHALEEVGPEHWSLSLILPPGRYTYLFRLEKDDGIHLIIDPASTQDVKDGLGRRLSVLDLSASLGDIKQ